MSGFPAAGLTPKPANSMGNLMDVLAIDRPTYTVTLPFPPTVNTYWRTWRGRTIISAKGRQYRAECMACASLRPLAAFSFYHLTVSIIAWLPDARRRDLDNLLKAPLDALGHARVYADDSQIHDLRIVRAGVDRDSPRLEITIGVLP